MACTVRTSLASTFIALAAALALGACGGDDTVTVTDAAVDAEIDAPIDAPPLTCNPPTMNCGGMCVNTTNDEQFCGNCTTQCAGGEICTNSTCNCPTVTLPTNASGGFAIEISGFMLGTNALTGNALIIALDPATVVVDQDYVLTEGTLGTLPTAGFGVDVDLLGMTAGATFAATEGTLRITQVCPDDTGTQLPEGGIAGTLTGVKFSAVDGLLQGNPVLVPDGCTLPPDGATPETVDITFSLGNVSCSNM